MMFQIPTEKSSILTNVLQAVQFVFLALITVVCVHAFLFQCSPILVPFVLSAFIVFTVEPTVSFLHTMLIGRSTPFRWCVCCCARAGASLPKHTLHSSLAGEGSDEPDDVAARLEAPEQEGPTEATPLLHEEDSDDVEQTNCEHVWEGLCRFLSVVLVLSFIVLMLLSLISLLVRGAMDMQRNSDAYRIGLNRLLTWMHKESHQMAKWLNLEADAELEHMYTKTLSKVEELMMSLVNYIILSATSGVTTLIIVMLYVLFWLLHPLPLPGKASALVRSYIWKKTLVSMLYGACVSLLFYALGIDLAIFFGLVSYFLNYLPEVGSFISILTPMPVIILDGRLDNPCLTVGTAAVGQMLLKIAFNNFLELKLVAQDQEMSIHPVWVLLNLNYFGFVWGPIGMLISVPMLALVKSLTISALETDDAMAPWADAVASCLEGRPGKPSSSWKRATLLRKSKLKGSMLESVPKTLQEKEEAPATEPP